jgi:hypothetical protein
MVSKLLEAIEGRWRAVNGPHLVTLVRVGARFEKSRLVERPREGANRGDRRGRRVIMRGAGSTGLTISHRAGS